MIWESIPYSSTQDPLGPQYLSPRSLKGPGSAMAGLTSPPTTLPLFCRYGIQKRVIL